MSGKEAQARDVNEYRRERYLKEGRDVQDSSNDEEYCGRERAVG